MLNWGLRGGVCLCLGLVLRVMEMRDDEVMEVVVSGSRYLGRYLRGLEVR